MNEKIKTLRDAGQSLWYDNMQRVLLTGGRMAQMIDGGIIQGVTSNPTIFEKAISGLADYAGSFEALAKDGKDVTGIYLGLVEEDIRLTADLLRPIHQDTQALDGFVSLEVSPHLAHDAQGTIDDAMSLVGLLDRPNVMIKVPGTQEGVQAIRELTFKGISINVTLLFSLAQYEAVARAYMEGLEARLANGGAVDHIASVASFFVSRVDTMVDQRLEAEVPERADILRGKAAIANAKMAYRLGQELFSGSRWEKVAARGGRPQRLLWASTGTKDPRYSDTLYVDSLIGPGTVNTVPPHTLDAFMDHGKPAPNLLKGLEEAMDLVDTLDRHGIRMDDVGRKLQTAGIASFATSMDSLLNVITCRLAELRA